MSLRRQPEELHHSRCRGAAGLPASRGAAVPTGNGLGRQPEESFRRSGTGRKPHRQEHNGNCYRQGRAVEHWTRGKRGNWEQQDLLPMASSKGFTIIPDATGLEGSYGDPASPRTAKTLNMRAPTTQGSNPTIGKTACCHPKGRHDGVLTRGRASAAEEVRKSTNYAG